MARASGATAKSAACAGGVSLIGTITGDLRFYKRGRWAPQEGGLSGTSFQEAALYDEC